MNALIIVESPRTVDGPSLRAVSDLAARDRAFVVVLTSVLEEKANRVVEIVISTITPRQLLAVVRPVRLKPRFGLIPPAWMRL